MVFDNINKLDLQIKKWSSSKKRILIVGSVNHTKLIFKLFPSIQNLNLVGYVDYLEKSKNRIRFLKKVDFKKIHFEKFDEVFISSFEHNFDILEDLKNHRYKTYSMYGNMNRSLIDIYKKNIISIFKKYNFRKK